MGTLCILGVDDNRVLKDFVRAHVELLHGDKVCVSNWYPEYRFGGKAIRYFYSTNRFLSKAKKLLPQALYQRTVINKEYSETAIHDALSGFFREHDVDVILAEFGTAGAEIYRHARMLGIPVVVHFHGHDAHRRPLVEQYRERYREMFGYAFRVISVSHYMTEALVELGADRSRIVYNPYGPRERFFDNAPDYRPTVLSVGRFTDIKASHLTLMAFSRAARDLPDARLVMVGEGELLESCKMLAKVWGVDEQVSFPGAIPHAEVTTFFSQACCFAQHSVVPSYGDAEGTPVAILEAGAAALPVVSTRHAGIVDAVVHGETGFLVDETDVEGMAGRMRTLLGDSELCRTMGLKAREHIRTSYNIDRHIACLQEVIDAARS
ncbi:MAG TPA: glycosyltransferase [Gemmatimonadaceae bacterium]|nr:glycosyltransferase [Gemmatimonadaceae bacterium]